MDDCQKLKCTNDPFQHLSQRGDAFAFTPWLPWFECARCSSGPEEKQCYEVPGACPLVAGFYRAPGSQTGAGVSSHQSQLLVQHPVTQQACSAAPSLLGSVVMDSNLPSLSSPSFPLSGFKNIHLKLQYGLARAAACSDEWDDTGRTEAFGLVGAAWRRAETSSAQDRQEKAPTASLPLSSCVHGQK